MEVLNNKLFRFFLLGPFAGALVSATTTFSGVIIWMYYDQIDFYFRGWPGVSVHFMMNTFFNSIASIIPGGILLFIEHITERRVRMICYLITLPILLFSIFIPYVYVEFSKHEIFGHPFLEPILFVIISIFLGLTLLRRDTEQNTKAGGNH